MTLNLIIKRGATFRQGLRWARRPLVYKLITGMPSTAPVRFAAPAHGLVNGWPAAITQLQGPVALNAKHSPPLASDDPALNDYLPVTVVDANTVEFNDLNAAGMPAYVSGGVLQYYTPVDLAGCVGRWQIRAAVDDPNPAFSGTTGNGGVILNNTERLIELYMTDEQSTALLLTAEDGKGVWDVEIESPDGEVFRIESGVVRCVAEVTR